MKSEIILTEQDFIIVGQGVAGSVLAYFLRKNGQKVLVFDGNTDLSRDNRERSSTASKIAAGVINPITGRRFVKSWRMDALLPVAKRTYQDLEKLLNVPLWHERDIVRTLKDVEEENNFLLRRTYPDYQDFCGESIDNFDNTHLNPFYAFAAIKKGAQVNLPFFVAEFRRYLVENQSFISEKIASDDLIFSDDSVIYKNIKAKKIIFADGAAGATNPYFSWLPFNLDKGELLLVRIPNWDFKHIFKHKISIVPLHDVGSNGEWNNENLYWVGATNAWQFENDLPTEANKQLILNELREILNCPFEVVAHHAAVRPTVRDRRPFIGLHPQILSLGIFNGFGTKGASLIPFFAEHFVHSLLNQVTLEKDIDIKRFTNMSCK